MVKEFGHSGFRCTLPELFAGLKGSARKGKRPLVAPGFHVSQNFLCFSKLRCAQCRHHTLQRPVIEGALVFKFERADRVRDVFKRIFNRMRKGVHRVDAPLVAGCLVFGKADTVDRGIAQIDVGRSHINLGSQNHGAFGVPAVAHFAEDSEVFLGRSVTEG